MAEVILGIDPGSRNTGYSILTEKQGALTALRCDVIHLSDFEDHADRLQHIFESITKIARSFNPTACAIETPVYGVDPLAMLKLGRAQAAAMLALTNIRVPVVEYYPKEIKKSITGNGNASKKQVAYMLRKMITLPDEKLSDDATDALAVAWCHIMKSGGVDEQIRGTGNKAHQNRKKSSWKEFVEDNPDRIRE